VSYICCILCSDLFSDADSIAGYTHWNVRLWRITNSAHPVFRRYIQRYGKRLQKNSFVLFDPEDGGTTFPRNIRKHSPKVTVAHHSRTSDVTVRLPVKLRRHNTGVVGSTFTLSWRSDRFVRTRHGGHGVTGKWCQNKDVCHLLTKATDAPNLSPSVYCYVVSLLCLWQPTAGYTTVRFMCKWLN